MSMHRALRSERGFGLFWLGFSASVLGDAVSRTTLVWYVLDLTGSTVALGWLSFCFTAPVVVGGVTAGWLLDRYDRRTIMVVDSLAKSLLVTSVTIGFGRLPIAEGLAICLAALLSGLAVAGLALSPDAAGAAVALALYGAFSAPLTIWGQTLRMKIIPPGFHGRCFAIMRTLMQSGGPLGGVSADFALPALGVRAAIAAIALITCEVGGFGLTIAQLRRAR